MTKQYISHYSWLNTKMVLSLSLVILLCFCVACDSENISEPYQDQAFIKYYGDTKNQTGVDLKPYKDGWLLLGSARSFGYEAETFYLLKVDQEGNEEWSLTSNSELGENSNDEIFEKPSKGLFMKIDETGEELILLGETQVKLPNENGETFNKIFAAKINLLERKVEWSKIMRREVLSNEYAGAIDFDDTGGYIVVGQTDDVDELKHNHDPERDLTDFFINSLDATGESIWENIYGFPYNDFAKTVKEEGGEYIVIGNSQNGGQNNAEFVMSRYNGEGGILESKQYGAVSGNINLSDAIPLFLEDRTILYGYNSDEGKPIFQMLNANLDATTNIFNLDTDVEFSSVGGIYITNDSPLEFLISATVEIERDNGSKDTDIYLNKVRFEDSNSSGNSPSQTFLWDVDQKKRTFGGVGQDIAGKIVETTDGGTALIGTIDINTNTMMSLIHTNSEGELKPILPE
jgi:hypothetical protein